MYSLVRTALLLVAAVSMATGNDVWGPTTWDGVQLESEPAQAPVPSPPSALQPFSATLPTNVERSQASPAPSADTVAAITAQDSASAAVPIVAVSVIALLAAVAALR